MRFDTCNAFGNLLPVVVQRPSSVSRSVQGRFFLACKDYLVCVQRYTIQFVRQLWYTWYHTHFTSINVHVCVYPGVNGRSGPFSNASSTLHPIMFTVRIGLSHGDVDDAWTVHFEPRSTCIWTPSKIANWQSRTVGKGITGLRLLLTTYLFPKRMTTLQ